MNAFGIVLDIQNAHHIRRDPSYAFRQLFVSRLADPAEKPKDQVLAVGFNEHVSAPAVAGGGVDEKITQSDLDRWMNVNFWLLDEKRAGTAVESGDDNGDDLRHTRPYFRWKHKRRRTCVKYQATYSLVDVSLGKLLGLCTAIEELLHYDVASSSEALQPLIRPLDQRQSVR